MANRIRWNPGIDDDIQSYDLEQAPGSNGTWSSLVNVTASQTPSNFSDGQYYYVHQAGLETTWYRIFAIDAGGQRSQPSVPFQAGDDVSGFVPGQSTPFGTFDNDPEFQIDADRVLTYTRRKLGDPVMTVHLISTQVYGCFEEAALEYSAIINQYQAKSVLTQFLGAPTGSLKGSENTYPARLLEFQRRMAEPYGEEAGVNGTRPLYSGTIETQAGMQRYNLQEMLSGTVGNQRLQIKKIFHFSPTSALRLFGTTAAVNYLANEFDFESYTPETIFYLLPIWEDVLRGMQFETSNRIRRSNYSYELHNNELTLYPVPQDNLKIHFTYMLPADPTQASGSTSPAHNGVANLSNVPFGNIQYSAVNSMGKHWIRRMAFALAKEVEGQIRSKMNSIPIPNGELTLNGPELIQDARAEQEALRTELKELLDETTYDKLAAKEAEMAENLQRSLKEVPLLIYVG